MKRFPSVLRNLIIFLIIVVIAYKCVHIQHYLSIPPKEMQISNVIYVEEKSWGFGPGGNETGIIVYEMPDKVYENIKSNDIEYLRSLSSINGVKRYNSWEPTPIDKSWHEIPLKDEPSEKPLLSNYMNRYGFGIPISSEIEQEINYAIFQSGSFYSYRRTGVIIVAPSIHRIFYIYSG